MEAAPTIRGEMRDAAILRGVIASFAARILNAVVAVVTLGVAAQALTGEEFGLVASLFSLWMILTLFDLGVGGALVTRVAASHGRGDLNQMRTCVHEALAALSVIGLLIAALGTMSALVFPWDTWIGGDTLSPSTVKSSVALVFILAGASLPAAIGILTLTGQQRLAFAQLAMASRGLFTLMVTASVAHAGLGPWAFLLAFVGAPTLMSSILTGWVLVSGLPVGTERLRFVARGFANTIRESVHFAVCSIGNAVAFGSGTLIVAAAIGPGEAAVFAVASRMFALIGTMVNGAGRQLWPAMTEAITRGDIGWARSRYRQGIVIVALTTAAVSAAVVVVGQPVARVWVGSALVPSLELLVWTAAFTVAVAVSLQACVLLQALGRLRSLAALCVVNAIASVAASVLLTQAMGLSGAAAGGLVTSLVIFLPGVTVLARRALKDLGAS